MNNWKEFLELAKTIPPNKSIPLDYTIANYIYLAIRRLRQLGQDNLADDCSIQLAKLLKRILESE